MQQSGLVSAFIDHPASVTADHRLKAVCHNKLWMRTELRQKREVLKGFEKVKNYVQ